MILWVVSVLAVIATAQTLEWLVAYHRQTRGAWRDSEMGRHLMIFMAALASVFALATVRFITVDLLGHELPLWFEWLRLVDFLSIPIVLAWRRLLLARAQDSSEEP